MGEGDEARAIHRLETAAQLTHTSYRSPHWDVGMRGCSLVYLWLAVSFVLGCGGKEEAAVTPECLVDVYTRGGFFGEPKSTVNEVIPTVVEVRWQTAEPTIGWVEFGEAGDLSLTTSRDASPTREHEFLLLGLPHSSEVTVRAMAIKDGNEICAVDQTLKTGALDPGLVEMTLTESDPTQAAGGYTVVALSCWHGECSQSSGASGFVVILDELGRIVWFYAVQRGIFRAYLTLNRDAVAINYQAGSDDNEGAIGIISLDGSEVTSLYAPGIHTDFVQVDDERYASLAWTVQTVEDGDEERKLLGDLILEITTDGSYTVAWDIFDHVDPDLEADYHLRDFGDEGEVEEWSYLNGINYDPADDSYYLTSRSLNAVFKVDRGSGELLWTAGNDWGDFELSSGNTPIFYPHSVQPIDGGLLLFNSEDECTLPNSYALECSAAAELSMDFETWEFDESWCYATEDCLIVSALGNAQRLTNDNTMLVLSTTGQIDETTPDGELVWRVNSDFGWEFGFAERVDSLY